MKTATRRHSCRPRPYGRVRTPRPRAPAAHPPAHKATGFYGDDIRFRGEPPAAERQPRDTGIRAGAVTGDPVVVNKLFEAVFLGITGHQGRHILTVHGQQRHPAVGPAVARKAQDMPAHPPRDDRVVYDPALRLHGHQRGEYLNAQAVAAARLPADNRRRSGNNQLSADRRTDEVTVCMGFGTGHDAVAYRSLRAARPSEFSDQGQGAPAGHFYRLDLPAGRIPHLEFLECPRLRRHGFDSELLGMCRGGGKQEGHEEGQCEARAAKVFFHGSGKFCGSASKVRKIPRPAQFGAG